MKKSKLLKSLGFASLALLMGAAGVFAFAPLGANPSLASANTLSDEINTKADGENIKYAPSTLGLDPENDPVIYTTESGLEIKYGGENVNDQFASGKPLSGYPYFTMGTYNGYAVNWVIIGRNTNDTVFTSAISSYLYSTWKTNNNVSYSGLKPFAKYWFNGGGYETTTPAGSAINGVVPSKSYVADVTKATKTVVGNAEVPSGCVLAISECCLGYSYFNCTSAASSTYNAAGSANYGSRYRYLSTTGTSDEDRAISYSSTAGTLFTYISNLYSTNLGLTDAQKNMIQGQKLNTIYTTGANSGAMETYDTDGNTLHKMFPLAAAKQNNDATSWNEAYFHNNPGDENFLMPTYLTTNALRVAYQIGATTSIFYWLRSSEGANYGGACAIGLNNTTADGRLDGWWVRYNFGVRPACVVKFA